MTVRSMRLSFRQNEVFEFIKEFRAENGFPPTQHEIADQFKWKSPNAARCILILIEKKGFIAMHRNKVRAIEILK